MVKKNVQRDSHLKHFIQSIVFLVVQNIVKGSLWSWHCKVRPLNTDFDHQRCIIFIFTNDNHLSMQFLCLLAHVDDVVLSKHLWGVRLVPTRAAQRLAWNIQPLHPASAFQKDSDNRVNSEEEDWQKRKWLKVCDSAAVHSISLLRIVAKLIPVFFNCPQVMGMVFFFFFWPCCMRNEDAKLFWTSAYELQKSNQSLREWWEAVLSIHFSNLFPRPAQMTWINGKKIGMFSLLWKSDNLLQQQHYICRDKN